IVQEGASSDYADLLARKPHGPRHGDGEGCNALGMSFRFSVLEVQRVAQSFKRNVIRALQIGHSLPQLLGASRNQRLEIRLVRAIFQFESPMFEGAPNHHQELLPLKRLKEIVVSPIANGGESNRNIMDRSNHDD